MSNEAEILEGGYCNITNFINKDKQKETTMDIIGVIGWEVWDMDVVHMLNQIKDTTVINIRLDSLGGSIADGLTIHNLLLSHKAPVNITIIGKAASMGSGIAMAGDKVKMFESGMFMLHNPSSGMIGESKDFRSQADTLDNLKESLISLYSNKSGLSREKISNMMNAETFLTPQEALELGFIDEIIETQSMKAVAMAVPDFINLSKIPAFAQDLIKGNKNMSKEIKDAPIVEPEAANVEAKNEVNKPVVAVNVATSEDMIALIASNKAVMESNNLILTKIAEMSNTVKEANEAVEVAEANEAEAKKEVKEVKQEASNATAIATKMGVDLSSVNICDEEESKEDKTWQDTYKEMPSNTADERDAKADYRMKNLKEGN